jgi:RecA-family ATPase
LDIEKELKLINMEDVAVKEVNWLWKPYIPYGKITIIQGDPGEGKTTMILAIAAAITAGDKLPLRNKPIDTSNVIYQTAEDGLGDTIKPRLIASGADCSKIVVIDESDEELTLNDERIEKAIIETSAKLLILDPLQAYLGAKVDMHRANEIRPIFKSLAGVAERTCCAIVIIGHMNKSGGSKGMYRGLGSIDISAAARSILLVGRVKEEPNIRVMAQIKSSLASEGKSIAFELDENSGFHWIGEYEIDIDVLLQGSSTTESVLKRAEKLIRDILTDGAKESGYIYEKAKEKRISQRTLKTAKKNLEVKSIKTKEGWKWHL